MRDRRWSLGIIGVAIAFAAGYFYSVQFSQDPYGPIIDGLLWPPLAPLEPFELTMADQRPLTGDALLGKWTLLTFAHGRCAEACAPSLAALRSAVRALHRQSAFAARGQALVVSVDAAGDFPNGLAQLAQGVGPNTLVATAEPLALHLFTRQFAVEIVKSSGENAEDYWLDYPKSVFLIDPALRVVGEFAASEELASQVTRVIAFVLRGR